MQYATNLERGDPFDMTHPFQQQSLNQTQNIFSPESTAKTPQDLK